jgi:hypothetical protein
MTTIERSALSHAVFDDPVVRLLQKQGIQRAWERRWRCPVHLRSYYRKLLRCGVSRDVARAEVSR